MDVNNWNEVRCRCVTSYRESADMATPQGEKVSVVNAHTARFEVACLIHEQHGIMFSLGTLIGGRMATLNMCVALLSNAVTIAVRYSAVRQQFGPSDDCAGFAGLRNDNDASCTYEGDNNVLQQQASQWVVRLWGQRQEQGDQFPLGSVDLLYRSRADHMSAASERELCHPPVLLEAYEWLVCWLAEKTSQLYQSQVERGTDRFTARNHSQVYRGRSLSLAYAEHYMLKCLWKQCEAAEQQCADSHGVLTQLCALFGLSSLEKHQVFLHQGGYIDNSQSEMIHSAILTVCGQLKNEAVSLVDVVAPPDFILNSVLGHSSGKVSRQQLT
ncbi:acyl-Coenzyme A oxidase [Homalodisca vitripennis]|nr:acyl-Coenzyme A oxidase [Homalodisca vitripennis]